MQPLAECADALRRLLPQYEHHQILRIGKPKLGEHGAIQPTEQIGGGVEREADLSVEPQEIVVFAHRRLRVRHLVVTVILTSILPFTAFE